MLSQILAWQANTGLTTGDPIAARSAGEEGRDIADAIGDRSNSRMCRQGIGWVHLLQGNVVSAISEFSAVAAECEEAHDDVLRPVSLMGLGMALAHHGEVEAASAIAAVGLDVAADLGEYFVGMAYAQSVPGKPGGGRYCGGTRCRRGGLGTLACGRARVGCSAALLQFRRGRPGAR